MSFLEAILLGIVQGVTEFLPVSSSGHLAILSALLHTNEETELLFEIMLHMGTLAAVIFAFRSDIRRMFWETLRMISDIFYNVKAWIHNKIQETDESFSSCMRFRIADYCCTTYCYRLLELWR